MNGFPFNPMIVSGVITLNQIQNHPSSAGGISDVASHLPVPLPGCEVRAGHTIELRLDADGVHAHFNCHDGKAGKCHETCAQECPVWDEDCLANHERTVIDYCNPIEFIDNTGFWYESYIGTPDIEPHSGPVIFQWQPDEWYGWKYADDD